MKVLLADDHNLVRDAVASLLSQDRDVSVKAESDLPAALDAVRSHGPFDVVILDLKMPGMNGLEGARLMLGASDAPVIVMSGSARQEDVQAAIALGVKGFIPKTLAGRALLNAVRLVAEGETYVPMAVMQQTEQAGLEKPLTPRERDVLTQLRHGSSNKEIARVLGITETTVKLHLRSLSEKLCARNRVDLVIRAIEHQLI